MRRKQKDKTPQAHMTQQEVADHFGVTRAAIAAIETGALRKLKRRLEKRGIKLNDLLNWEG